MKINVLKSFERDILHRFMLSVVIVLSEITKEIGIITGKTHYLSSNRESRFAKEVNLSSSSLSEEIGDTTCWSIYFLGSG